MFYVDQADMSSEHSCILADGVGYEDAVSQCSEPVQLVSQCRVVVHTLSWHMQ